MIKVTLCDGKVVEFDGIEGWRKDVAEERKKAQPRWWLVPELE